MSGRRVAWLGAVGVAQLAWGMFAAPPTMKVSEVPVGATGEWRTCVEGTVVTTFPMRVVGVMQNSIYPGEAVILCEALDARNKHSGPVAGMSGSPVYVNGRIIGAYAYGPIFQRDQAHFMATPIEVMLKMRQLPMGSWGGSGGGKRFGGGFGKMLAPLTIAGASQRAVAWLAEQLRPYDIMVVEGGNTGLTNIQADLIPGSPVAGVILHGDISVAAVGTVTYREGDTILAFGHPFLQCGPIEMPMAVAEVLAVSHSFMRSYKMSNIGQIVGSIEQDRAPAVVGRIGRYARTVDVRVRTTHPVFGEREYRSRGLRHERFTPMMIMFALIDPLEMALEASRVRTTRYEGRFRFESGEEVAVTNVVDDEREGMAAVSLMRMVGKLLENEFAPLALESVEVRFLFEERVERARVERAWLERSEVRPGEELQVKIEIRPYQGEQRIETVGLRVPEDVRPGEYKVQICDADRAEEGDRVREMKPRSLKGLFEVARRHRRRDWIYVQLVGRTSGLVVGSKVMEALPPSVMARWRDEANASVAEAVLAEVAVPVNGMVRGFHQLLFAVK
ncbi:MAG: hypothetical protein N2595_10555 [bacterium]|nr:hypothetical protein [bacterium]